MAEQPSLFPPTDPYWQGLESAIAKAASELVYAEEHAGEHAKIVRAKQRELRQLVRLYQERERTPS